MIEFNIIPSKSNHRNSDVAEVVSQIYQKISAKGRYASYDFCYGYFQTHRHHLTENMELSCLHLWAYLASWGMLRGSSLLLKECSMKVLSGVIRYLDGLPEEVWYLDVPDYKSIRVRKKISQIYLAIQAKIKDIKLDKKDKHISATTTLVTKIMHGTLGCVPAFDQNFVVAITEEFDRVDYSFSDSDRDVLKCIYEFYNDNCDLLYLPCCKVLGFNGKPIMKLQYKYAKLIDMYWFNKGSIIQKRKKQNNSKLNT